MTPIQAFILILLDAILLAIVYCGVQHFSGHNCIALASVSALMFMRMGK